MRILLVFGLACGWFEGKFSNFSLDGRLPDSLRLEVQSGEPFTAVAERIDAGQVRELDDLAFGMMGMSHDHVLSGEMGFRGLMGDFDPSQEVDRLVFHLHLGVVVGMDDDMRWGFVVGEKRFEEFAVGGRDNRQVADEAVAFHGFVSPVVEPAEGFASSVEDREHHFFVVSHEWKELCLGFEFHEPFDDPFGVWSSVDVVSDGHDNVFLGRADGGKKGVQGAEAAVDITDCDGTCHGKIEEYERYQG